MVIAAADRYTVRSTDEDYERPWQEDEREFDILTAQNWCIHFRVQKPEDVQPLADKMLRSGAEVLTGIYIGGDSFAEWAEPYHAAEWYREHGVALHMYFTAPTARDAQRRGLALARIAFGDKPVEVLQVDAAVSTAADWAEQVEIG